MRPSQVTFTIPTVMPGPFRLFLHLGHHRLAPDPTGCCFLPNDGNTTSLLVDYDPRHCEHHLPSYALTNRPLPSNGEAIRRMGRLQRCGMGRATEFQYRELCGAHVPIRHGGVPHLVPQSGSNLDNSASRRNAFRKVANPCRMGIYLHRRDCSTDATCFVSVPVDADPSLQYSAGREQAWLEHSKQMGGLIYSAPSDLDSKWIQGQNKASYPEPVLHMIDQFRPTSVFR